MLGQEEGAVTKKNIRVLNLAIIILLCWVIIFLIAERLMMVYNLRRLNNTYLMSFAIENQVSKAVQDHFNCNVDMTGYYRDKAREEVR